jgi:hypothetical protein
VFFVTRLDSAPSAHRRFLNLVGVANSDHAASEKAKGKWE